MKQKVKSLILSPVKRSYSFELTPFLSLLANLQFKIPFKLSLLMIFEYLHTFPYRKEGDNYSLRMRRPTKLNNLLYPSRTHAYVYFNVF